MSKLICPLTDCKYNRGKPTDDLGECKLIHSSDITFDIEYNHLTCTQYKSW